MAALALGTLIACAVPGHAAPAPPREITRIWLLERTGKAPTSLDVVVSSSSNDEHPSFISLLGVDGPLTAPKAVGVEFFWGRQGGVPPQGYAGGNQVSCGAIGHPPVLCDVRTAGVQFTEEWGTETTAGDLPDAFIAVAHGFYPLTELGRTSRGWRLRELQPGLRLVKAQESDSAGLATSEAGAEAFVGASSFSTAKGSIGVGAPPCSDPFVPGGVGTATLHGGEASASQVCPTGASPALAVRGATEWQLDGPVVGPPMQPFRLVVIDLPLRALHR